MKVAILMTTFNRPDETRHCLDALEVESRSRDYEINVWVADASTNQYTSMLASGRQYVDLIPINDNMYWAQGMRTAWEAAHTPLSKPDMIVWMNDDVDLARGKLGDILDFVAEQSGPVVVGAAFRNSVGETSYGGYVRGPWWHRLALRSIDPALQSFQACDALNGNLIVTNRAADVLLGGFPKGFTHGMADLHYTLQAKQRGIPVYLAPGYAGRCENNPINSGWAEPGLRYRERWRRLVSSKGLPLKPWLKFTLSNGGIRGPLTALSPYLRTFLGMEPGRP